MSEPVLVVEGVVKEYGEAVRTRALSGVDLVVEPGEFTAVVGPSGSGKSTLLNVVGLLDRPTEGRVVLCGKDTTKLDDDGLSELRARALGFVFQFHHLLPAFSALENVLLPGWADKGPPTAEVRERAVELLRIVGLEELLHRKPSQLSGGQQQRVAIARSLAHRPPLVLADEPTGNLDTESADEVFRLMRRINVELRTAFLFITHDPRLALRCDRVVEIVDGKVSSDRPVEGEERTLGENRVQRSS
jgi:lipoprotein-releasing system ATP-binding protein